MWIGSMIGSHSFIMQKLGPAALEELNNEGAKHYNPGYSMGFAKKGMPLNKEQYCDGCINGYFKKVAENLGFKLEAEFTGNGCKITISR